MIDEPINLFDNNCSSAYDEGYSNGLEAGYEQALEAMFETLAQGLEPTAFNRVKELLMKGAP